MDMFKPTIKSRVMKVVKDRIDQAQKLHDEEIKSLDEKHKSDVKAMEERLTAKKDEVTETTVNDLVSMFVKK